MHDGAVRPGAGDGRERDVLQRAGVAAEGFQRLDGVDLGQRARRRFAVDPGEEPRQRHRVAPMRGPGALDLGGVLDRLEQADGIAAAHRLAAGGDDQPAQGVGGGGAVERDRCAALRQLGELWRQRVRLLDIGRLFEMVAGAVGEFAVIDEHRGPAVLRHQRIGQRQRRMRDVGAADVEGPRHRVRIRQHQRLDAESCDLQPDPLELVGLRFAGKLRAVNRRPGRAAAAGRSVQTESSGLLSTATSSAPALAQAAASRSAAAEVCSHGSNPRRSPAARCLASQLSGGGSTSGSMLQALRSTCLAACSV